MKRDLLIEIRIRHVKYFDSIKRHNTLLKIIHEGVIEGRQARGLTAYKWEHQEMDQQ